MSSPPLVQLAPGAVFAGDFRVVSALSTGGMGAIYVAEQLSTGKQRALKLMLPQLVADPRLRQRFEQEARIGARIESEHVVEVVGAGVDASTGTPWLAMELLRGEDLASLVARAGPVPAADVLGIFEQVCHAVGAAHAAGIVHRDLKPENVFLAQTKRAGSHSAVKVLDFGIAKIAAEAKTTATAAIGSPLWMAPEQTSRGSAIAPPTDVWALGLIAFYLLTGRYFWRSGDDDGSTMGALLREIIIDPMPSASVRAAELAAAHLLPAGFDAWLARAIDRDPAARFPTATDAFAHLARVLGAPRVGATQVDARSSLPSSSPVSPPVRSAPATPPAPTLIDPTLSPAATVYGSGTHVPERAASSTTAGVGLGDAPRPGARGGARGWIFGGLAVAVVGGIAVAAVMLTGAKPTPPTASSSASAPAPKAASAAAVETPVKPSAPPDAVTGKTVALPGGTFSMGASDGAEDERPVHDVNVAPFSMDVTEVSALAWRACEKAGACPKAVAEVSFAGMTEADRRGAKYCNGVRDDRLDHPMNCVTFDEARTFCAWAGKRLPTEAEWEYAARAVKRGGADARPFPWGTAAPDALRLNACGTECVAMLKREDLLDPGEKATPLYNADDTFPATAPVGSFPRGATEHGLMDMAGNVAEWTADEYGPYPGPTSGKSDKRVTRGGAWLFQDARFLKTSRRGKDSLGTRDTVLGFRCARDAAP